MWSHAPGLASVGLADSTSLMVCVHVRGENHEDVAAMPAVAEPETSGWTRPRESE